MEKVERVEGQELSQILHYLPGGKNLHQHMAARSILQLQTLVFDYLCCWWKCFRGDSVLFVWSPHNVLLARNITSQKWTKILFFSSVFFSIGRFCACVLCVWATIFCYSLKWMVCIFESGTKPFERLLIGVYISVIDFLSVFRTLGWQWPSTIISTSSLVIL